MTNPNRSHIALLVDRSGSMNTIREDAQGGINGFITEQLEVPGDVTVSLYEFDDEYNHVFGPVAVSEAPTYQLVPRGWTALIDSLWRAIEDTGAYLRSIAESERPAKVVFVIMTDGKENTSRLHGMPELAAVIRRQEKEYNWQFIFLGANIDAFTVGNSLGIRLNTQFRPTGASTRQVYGATAQSVSSYLASPTMNSFSIEDIATDVDDEGNVIYGNATDSSSEATN